MRPRCSRTFLAAAALSGITVFTVWSQGSVPPPPQYQAWVTYFQGPEGLQTLDRLQGTLAEISVFALQFDGKGQVHPASPWVTDTLAQLAAAPKKPARLWLTVVNDVQDGHRTLLKDSRIVHRVLATPSLRTRHVEDLLSKMGPADGLDIDYEALKKEDGEAFSLFIEELAQRLHANRKFLSVTVEPKTSLLPGNGARAVDWARIGIAADQVRVMAYFYHSSKGAPGPIALLSWLSDLAQFAHPYIPPEKLTIILAVNGLDWAGKGRARGVRFAEAEVLLKNHQATQKRDASSQSPYFHYSMAGEPHQVWYEDAISLQAKIRRLKEEGVQRIGFWQLGSGDPAFWKWLAQETSKAR